MRRSETSWGWWLIITCSSQRCFFYSKTFRENPGHLFFIFDVVEKMLMMLIIKIFWKKFCWIQIKSLRNDVFFIRKRSTKILDTYFLFSMLSRRTWWLKTSNFLDVQKDFVQISSKSCPNLVQYPENTKNIQKTCSKILKTPKISWKHVPKSWKHQKYLQNPENFQKNINNVYRMYLIYHSIVILRYIHSKIYKIS